MRTKAPLLALFLTAACPEQVGQQCPPRTILVGQYALNFAGQDAAGGCTSDASVAATDPPVSLAKPDGGTSFGAICFGTVDAGAQISLVIPNKGVRTSNLLADGGFRFVAHTDPVAGTPCVCAVAVDETLDGYLQTSAGTSFALQADGGLPEVTNLTGRVVDQLSTDAGGGCYCSLPCQITYAISGPRQ